MATAGSDGRTDGNFALTSCGSGEQKIGDIGTCDQQHETNSAYQDQQGEANIANQRVSSKQIHLDSSAGIVDLRGSVGLDSTLDYQGTATLNPSSALGSSAVGGIVGGLIGSRVGKITVPFALGGTIDKPKVEPGKGVPGFGAPSTATGSAPSTGQPAAPQNPVDAIKNIFKKP